MTHTPTKITRWPGKPTSGRFVYGDRQDVLDGDGHLLKRVTTWGWQCDLHDDDPSLDDQWGEGTSWLDAVAGALAHAAVCPFVSASYAKAGVR